MHLDLSSLASVRNFTAAFRARGKPLHILVDNAGVMGMPHGLTVDGLETTLGVNHFGHVLLTLDLLPLLEKSTPSRVVIVASDAHKLTLGGA